MEARESVISPRFKCSKRPWSTIQVQLDTCARGASESPNVTADQAKAYGAHPSQSLTVPLPAPTSSSRPSPRNARCPVSPQMAAERSRIGSANRSNTLDIFPTPGGLTRRVACGSRSCTRRAKDARAASSIKVGACLTRRFAFPAHCDTQNRNVSVRPT